MATRWSIDEIAKVSRIFREETKTASSRSLNAHISFERSQGTTERGLNLKSICHWPVSQCFLHGHGIFVFTKDDSARVDLKNQIKVFYGGFVDISRFGYTLKILGYFSDWDNQEGWIGAFYESSSKKYWNGAKPVAYTPMYVLCINIFSSRPNSILRRTNAATN